MQSASILLFLLLLVYASHPTLAAVVRFHDVDWQPTHWYEDVSDRRDVAQVADGRKRCSPADGVEVIGISVDPHQWRRGWMRREGGSRVRRVKRQLRFSRPIYSPRLPPTPTMRT
ncbi:unnamed protein product [Hydatigera taeniaeformis]|uniref:Uncharacterized protein n=1 Tax=Hydatigena taeniaeformis TaxID=6205 RepID=A0A0R3X9I5_HYDTA|nr:unnamed protein product [Hydatigera taeniaeformis]